MYTDSEEKPFYLHTCVHDEKNLESYAGREEKPPDLYKDVMMSKIKFIYPIVDIGLDTT